MNARELSAKQKELLKALPAEMPKEGWFRLVAGNLGKKLDYGYALQPAGWGPDGQLYGSRKVLRGKEFAYYDDPFKVPRWAHPAPGDGLAELAYAAKTQRKVSSERSKLAKMRVELAALEARVKSEDEGLVEPPRAPRPSAKAALAGRGDPLAPDVGADPAATAAAGPRASDVPKPSPDPAPDPATGEKMPTPLRKPTQGKRAAAAAG